jgi:alkanesulfonate monooxygenase
LGRTNSTERHLLIRGATSRQAYPADFTSALVLLSSQRPISRRDGSVMPVEMIGWIAPRISSEVVAPQGPSFNPDIIAATARVHEKADFDRVLIGYFTDAPDGFLIGAHAAAATKRLGLLLAHRPGFVSPTLAARKLATLDQLSGGRLAVHIIAGGSDVDQARDGDFIDHAGRYRRVSEYIDLLRRTWTSMAPFDHAGEFYRVSGAYSDIRCKQSPHIPIYGGGGSNDAIQALAPHVDHYMLWGEPLRETSEFMGQVRQAAAAAGKPPPRFSLSTRPILAETDDKAWDRAHTILERVKARRGGVIPPKPESSPRRQVRVAIRPRLLALRRRSRRRSSPITNLVPPASSSVVTSHLRTPSNMETN